MSLRSDKWVLENQLERIEDEESSIGAYNRKLDALIEEIRDSIVSDNVENLVDAVDGLRDSAGAGGRDNSINNAKARIENEIRVIEIAIEAQRRAAQAMREAANKT